ncbi:medium-chain acyl-CoA ligase ACSF2, mitochondrial-like [Thrips palmi]|uniref:Medium-chain acyl-CoA ligase ACSF2, mitochondrial n=1 Tax=Thrips palmi TaxID=161013 RepID=A0A6P8ZPZ8_THRPL|nr:medium-chain acyl-CoA ligase ACSF2, mitochondrial-like [Thrips palmi]
MEAPCAAGAPAPSYWHQVGEQPLLYATLGQLTAHAARAHAAAAPGQSPPSALVGVAVRLDAHGLLVLLQADQLAAGLLGLGLRRGDRVAIWAGNSWRWVVAKLAVARAGLVSVDLNPQYRESELAHCLKLSRASVVVAGVENRGQPLHDVLCALVPELRQCHGDAVRSEALPDLKAVVTMSDQPLPGALCFSEVMASVSEERVRDIEEQQWSISPDSVACIQMSSGTTGKPKAILITHRGVVNNSFLTGKRLGLHESHRVCLQVPLFHAFGTVIALMPTLHFGTASVLPAPAFSAHRSLEAMQQEGCSVLMGTPTMYVDLARLVQEKGVAVGADVAMIAGAPITPQLAKRMVSTLGVKRISNGYGLSEVSALVFLGKEGDSADCMAQTVGSVTEHAEVKVVDENGDTVPFGTPGELMIRGYLVMDGYFNDDEATAKAIQHGWFRTGDKFVLEENGYGRIQGRIKDMIIRGGENIYPKEVEDVLADHPDVLEAEVVGVPDERLGEEVCACVRLRHGVETLSAAELRHFCGDAMAAYKLPRYCLVVADFPRTLSGKIQKYVLRDQCAKALQAGTLDDGRPAGRTARG